MKEGQGPDDVRRKLSRATLKAAQRGRKELFDRLTADNAAKIEEMSKEAPLHYERQEDAESKLEIDDDIRALLPPEFFADPTGWIEAQPTLDRSKEGVGQVSKVSEYWGQPYDPSKVKLLQLSVDHIVLSKRLQPNELQETETARLAYQKGIPTPKVLGEIAHHGNHYAWFEYVYGENANAYYLQHVDSQSRLMGSAKSIELLEQEHGLKLTAAERGMLEPTWSESEEVYKKQKALEHARFVLLDVHESRFKSRHLLSIEKGNYDGWRGHFHEHFAETVSALSPRQHQQLEEVAQEVHLPLAEWFGPEDWRESPWLEKERNRIRLKQ